jgi:hypothetical protein
MPLQQADTGIVRLDANLRQAPQLRQMPIHLDLEWRQAQLGQLTRLILGSDAGWRGDLTGELQLDGTADAAQIKTRLRATGVHRAEFAPVASMDFDANCTLAAHFTTRAIDNLLCDSPLGDGHIRLTGNLPGDSAPPRFSVELDRIPVAAGLDALRTVRSDLAPGLEAAGSASGKITYAPEDTTPSNSAPSGHERSAKARPAVQEPLTGNVTIQGLQLSGNNLSEPIRIPKVLLEPAPASPPSGASQVLAATVAIPAGAAVPLTVSTRLALSGYQLTLRGQASVKRGRELAHLAGIHDAAALDALSGDPVSVDLTAEGPWWTIPTPIPALPPASASPAVTGAALQLAPPADAVAGTVLLRNATWKADYLANPVKISQATLHLASGELRWDPVVFSYGPVKGTATLSLPTACDAPQSCPPAFEVQFGALDAAVLQTAFLGAHEPGTLLSTLLHRLRPTAAPAWPQMEGTVKAESLVLGPVTLHKPEATLSTLASGAEITAFDAALFGGHIHGTGTLHTAASAHDKPSYAFEAQLDKLSPSALGQLLGLRCMGGDFNGNGKIELAGFTGDDLAASAKGTLHFEWRRGTVAATSGFVPPALARFDRWTADAEIANGALTLKDNQVKRGVHTASVQAAVTLAIKPRVTFPAPKSASVAIKPARPRR